MARASIVGATIFASITSSTVVVGLDPAELPNAEPVTITAEQPATTETPPLPVAETVNGPANLAAEDECREFSADFCVEIPQPAEPTPDQVNSCSTGAEHAPSGTIGIVPVAASPDIGAIRLRVEVETGLGIDPECFAAEVMGVLNDDRGWSGIYGEGFSQVDDSDYDLRLILASPATTDTLCYPARTAGIYSCRRGSQVVINLDRWESGIEEYADDLTTYRQYLLNHEVGHFLGHGHLECPGQGEPAPVMMQQTKGLDGCTGNGWPTENER